MGQKYHHGDLRSSLISDAVQLLETGGEAALTMRGLASRADVSRTAAYHHFKNKQELLCAVAAEGFRGLKQIIDSKVESPASEDTVREIVGDYLGYATKHRAYYDLMFSRKLWSSGDITDELHTEAYSAFRAYVELVNQWQADDQIDASMDALQFSKVSWATLHGLGRLTSDGIYIDSDAMEEMCRSTAEMLWRSMVPSLS